MKSSLLIVLAFVGAQTAFADLDAGHCTDAQKARITTSHQAVVGGKALSYTATIGFMEVNSADATAKACIFYTAYSVQTPPGSAPRPITFAFNGGPGSASLWLHLGLLGPKRPDLGPEGLTPKNAAGLVPNDDSLLDLTDVVMIDPVATGYSHPENGAASDKFFGVKNDWTSIAGFIQSFLSAYSRWESPKYLLGESYGGIRGSLLARHLQSDYGIGLSGVVLISPALSDVAFFSEPDNMVPYWTYFPSFAATAWYHKRGAPRYQAMDVGTVYREAKAFAGGPLRDALDLGNSLDAKARLTAAQGISDFLGFPVDQVQGLNLRIDDRAIFSRLEPGRVVGRYDSRAEQTAIPAVAHGDPDPSFDLVNFPFTAAINDYLRVELGFNLPSPYVGLADPGKWPVTREDGDSMNVMPDLAQALSDNPNLHVLIASGYYDLACPMGTVEYELDQMSGGAAVRDRVQQTRYPSGHMVYTNPVALAALKADLSAFFAHPAVLR